MKISPFMWLSLTIMLVVVAGAFCLTTDQLYLLIGGCAIVYFLAMFFGVINLRLQYFGPAFCCNRQAGKRVTLTFDDGPDPQTTPELLKLLKRRKVRATFFVIGNKAQENPALVKEIIAQGHTIGNHTMNHYWWTNFMGEKLLTAEISRATKILEDITGQKITYYRPPVGLTNNVVARVIRRLGLTCIGFSAGRFDQQAQDSERVVNRILSGIKNGDVIVLHDGNCLTATVIIQIVDQLLAGLTKAGFEVVSLNELMNTRENQNENN